MEEDALDLRRPQKYTFMLLQDDNTALQQEYITGLLLYGRRSGLPLPWQARENHPVVVRCYDVFITAYLMYKIACTTYSIVHIEKFEVRVYLMSAFFYFLSGLLLILFFYLKGEEYLRLVERVDRLTAALENSGLGDLEYFQQRYESVAGGLWRFSKFMAFSAIWCPAMFCTSVPLMDYLEGQYRTRTAVPAQCPVELSIQRIPGVFELIVLQQGLAYTIPSFHKFVSEVIMLALFNYQTCVFSYLSLALKGIAKGMSSVESREDSFEKLKVWIRLHQEAMEIFEDIISLFSPLVVMYYLLTIVTTAGSLLYMMDGRSSNLIQSLFGGGYMAMTMLSLFLQCQAADEATVEAQNITNEVYNLPWYLFDKKTNSFIKLILMMVTKPVYVDAYRSPAFRLSLASYQALFLNTLSAYMGFQKVKDLQQNLD